MVTKNSDIIFGSGVKNLIGAVCILGALSVFASCHRQEARVEDATPGNSLSDTTLVDQNGNKLSLASLKGKPVLVDFIYTSCPGPCLMETAKLANVAVRLGTDLGSKAVIVSISVDPEHDGPKQLLAYSREQGADTKGWYFLTGTPADVDRALAGFKMARQKGPDGSVGHLEDMILIGPDGKEFREYNAQIVKAQDIVHDIKETLNKG